MKTARQGYNLYKNGLPFSNGLPENINDLKERIELKKASLIVIDGGVGEGKTTLAVQVADYFQQSPINLKKQLSMGGKEFQEKFKVCIDEGLRVIIYDEAGDFNRRGALTSFNSMLNRVFETYRGYKILVILALPNFGVLDKVLFENQIPRLLIHCYGRSQNYGNYKGYSLLRMFYLRDKMSRLTVPPQAYGRVEPNFFGHFKDLNPSRSQELENISLEGKKKVLNTNIEKINKNLFSSHEITKICNRSTAWLSLKLTELNIKPNYKQGKTCYYSDEIVERLKAEVR